MSPTFAFDTGRRWKTVFHVTHRSNLPSIYRAGLLPCLSRRPAKRVWLADLELVPWAIRHVCATQQWHPDEVILIRVCVLMGTLIRHRAGIYYSHVVIPAEQIGALQQRNTA